MPGWADTGATAGPSAWNMQQPRSVPAPLAASVNDQTDPAMQRRSIIE